jgi:hypothetical protein
MLLLILVRRLEYRTSGGGWLHSPQTTKTRTTPLLLFLQLLLPLLPLLLLLQTVR